MFHVQNLEGKLFARTSSGELIEGKNFLEDILYKYQNANFESEINSSKIFKMDCFLDVFFLETENFFLFEKFTFLKNKLSPYNLFNNLFLKENSLIDYWYEEKTKKILICSLKTENNKFILSFWEFLLNNGQCNKILEEDLHISSEFVGWEWDSAKIKNINLTFNKDSKTYNVSFLINFSNNWSLISVFLYFNPNLKIKESKGVFLS